MRFRSRQAFPSAMLVVGVVSTLCCGVAPNSVRAQATSAAPFVLRVGQEHDFELAYLIDPVPVRANRDWPTRGVVRLQAAALVVRVQAMDPQPDRITASIGPHDSVAMGDGVQLLVDALGNGRRAYSFWINASGATADSIVGYLEDGAPYWTGRWTSTAARTPDGYSVEFTIPLATLGLKLTADAVAVGLNVVRHVQRGNSPSLSLAPVDRRQQCEACQFVPVRLAAASAGPADGPSGSIAGSGAATTAESDAALAPTPPAEEEARWTITPYAAALASSASDARSTRDAYAGLDATWSLGQRHRVLLALRPDFLQLDIDPFQITLNRRFATLLPEVRPFFTADPGIWSAGELPLVYTRLVTDVQWATQYLSRTPGRTLGALVSRDAFTNTIEADSQSSRFRVREEPSTTLLARGAWGQDGALRSGVLLSARSSQSLDAHAASADIDFTPSPEHRWRLQGATSSFTDRSADDARRSGQAFSLSHTLSLQEWSGSTTVQQIDAGFQAPLGSVSQTGVRSVQSGLGWTRSFVPEGDAAGLRLASRPVDSMSLGASGYATQEIAGGKLLQRGVSASIGTSFPGGHSIDMRASRDMVRFDGVAMTSTTVTIGGYWKYADAGVMMPTLIIGSSPDYARLTNGRFGALQVVVGQSIGQRLTVRASVSLERLRHDDGGGYDAAVGSAQATYSFDARHQLRARQIFSRSTSRGAIDSGVGPSTQRDTGTQLVYTYKPQKTWSVVAGWRRSQNRITDIAPRQGTTAFVKMSYEFSD